MLIAPGEPVPPGFENEVKPIAELQPILDRTKDQPMLGLEYLMELIVGPDKDPTYHCVICDKRGDPRTIILHLQTYNHRMKYLEKHYPSIIREMGPNRFAKEARPVMQRIVLAVCEAIEDHHGRLTPNVHDGSEYTRNRMKYLQEAISDKHFDEKNGPNFISIVDKKAIQDAIRSGRISYLFFCLHSLKKLKCLYFF